MKVTNQECEKTTDTAAAQGSEFFVNTGVLHVSGELNRTILDPHNASTVRSDSWSCVAFEQQQVRVHGLNEVQRASTNVHGRRLRCTTDTAAGVS